MKSRAIALCVFDAYGTLFDLNSVLEGHTARLGDSGTELLAVWRRKQLEYTWVRSLIGRYAPFDVVTADALRYALRSMRRHDPLLEGDLLRSFNHLKPYPDVAPAVASLRHAGLRMAVLSNGTPAMIASSLEASGLDNVFSPVISVDSIGVYKPDPRVYALIEQQTGVPPHATAYVCANFWDAAGAAVYGLRVVRLHRSSLHPDILPGTPEADVSNLTDLAAVIARMPPGQSRRH